MYEYEPNSCRFRQNLFFRINIYSGLAQACSTNCSVVINPKPLQQIGRGDYMCHNYGALYLGTVFVEIILEWSNFGLSQLLELFIAEKLSCFASNLLAIDKFFFNFTSC